MLTPPKDVAPEVLFRRLLALPRPSVAIDHRIRGAESVALRVQAVTAAELAGTGPEVVAASLMAGPRLAFQGPESVSRVLTHADLAAILDAISTGLGQCSPVDGRSDHGEWGAVLLQGAKHSTNQRAAYSLGSHFDVMGQRIGPRPERYFGVPAHALVDAHWFAYQAAVSYYVESNK